MKFPIEVITTCVQRSVRYVEAESEAKAVAKIQQEIDDTPEHFDDDDVVIYSHNVAVADKSDVYL